MKKMEQKLCLKSTKLSKCCICSWIVRRSCNVVSQFVASKKLLLENVEKLRLLPIMIRFYHSISSSKMHPGREVDCSETIRTGVRLPKMNWRAGDLLIKQKQKKLKL
jgi:hypothetical protein